MKLKDLTESLKLTDSKCNGLLFRGRVSMFFNRKNEIVVSKRLYQLKNHEDACSGCSECLWLLDYLQEDLNCEIEPVGFNEIENKQLYRIEPKTYRDYETGHYEIDYLKIRAAE